MRGTRLAGSWLVGAGAAGLTLAVVRGNLGGLTVPFLLGATGLLLFTHAGQTLRRFPGTELERRLDRLFALLLPARTAAATADVRVPLAHQLRLARLRRDARRWGKELQLIATDGYETATRISALHASTGEQDDQALLVKAVHALGAERERAGADMTCAADPVSLLAYGLGARPANVDLTSLEDLLGDLGLSEQGDELRTHFDDVLAQTNMPNLQLKNDAERRTFRDLAGASFVLGAAARILELASSIPALTTTIPAGAPSRI